MNDSTVSFLEAKETAWDQRMQCSLLRTYFLEAAVLIDPMGAAVRGGGMCVGGNEKNDSATSFPKDSFRLSAKSLKLFDHIKK